jgi:hypothetical protein
MQVNFMPTQHRGPANIYGPHSPVIQKDQTCNIKENYDFISRHSLDTSNWQDYNKYFIPLIRSLYTDKKMNGIASCNWPLTLNMTVRL